MGTRKEPMSVAYVGKGLAPTRTQNTVLEHVFTNPDDQNLERREAAILCENQWSSATLNIQAQQT